MTTHTAPTKLTVHACPLRPHFWEGDRVTRCGGECVPTQATTDDGPVLVWWCLKCGGSSL
jgi:hypothetical protein